MKEKEKNKKGKREELFCPSLRTRNQLPKAVCFVGQRREIDSRAGNI